MIKRNTLLAFALITTAGAASLGALAAAPAGAGNTPPPPGAQDGQPPLGMPLPPFPGAHGGPGGHGEGFCHGDELFCASMASDNPTESLQKLNSILPPAANGVHYQVRVAVVAIPDHKPGAGEERGGKPAPRPGQSAPQP
ncbi:hypothetical protein AAH678_14540 [Sodalis endosymbiont of Spalangia cameroni]|uniref:hypothetical protein n=1 Tax=Sodalis praecaptivus TaxID=1239307 RepID=UPI0031F8A9C4